MSMSIGFLSRKFPGFGCNGGQLFVSIMALTPVTVCAYRIIHQHPSLPPFSNTLSPSPGSNSGRFWQLVKAIRTNASTSCLSHHPEPIKNSTDPASLQSIGSIFNLSTSAADKLTTDRLLPQDTRRGCFGCASQTGFLARNESLFAVAEADREVLRQCGINYATIATRLGQLARPALAQPNSPVCVEDKFEVTVESWGGFQYCPFSPEDDKDAAGPHTRYDKVCPGANCDFTITNKNTGKSIRFSALLPHLIRTHHFFLGSVPHRLDPKKVIEVLELSRDPEGFVELK